MESLRRSLFRNKEACQYPKSKENPPTKQGHRFAMSSAVWINRGYI